jgi:hypothetical protein
MNLSSQHTELTKVIEELTDTNYNKAPDLVLKQTMRGFYEPKLHRTHWSNN